MSYAINGSSMSYAPFEVRWVPLMTLMDHNQQPVYSGYDIEMKFDNCCVADGSQWLDAVSSGSINLTVLNRWSIAFTTLSSVYCEINDAPAVQDVHLEPFSITVHGVYV